MGTRIFEASPMAQHHDSYGSFGNAADYAMSIGARTVVPIHDAVLSDVGKQLKKDRVLELEDGDVIDAPTAAALAGKLQQASSGAIYTDDE